MLRSFTVKLPTLPYMCPVMRKNRKEEITIARISYQQTVTG